MESVSDNPLCIVVLGMAGSGKTTFVNGLQTFLESKGDSCYTINLDPAVVHVPYKVNIDIRDTVKFKEVMKQYGFGPNGAIMTSLNFFTSKFHKVIELIQSKASSAKYCIIDTPGQIEVFTWSASGMIITESLTDIIGCNFAIEWMQDFEAFQTALAEHRGSVDGPLGNVSAIGGPCCSPYMASLTNTMSLVLDEFYSELKSVGVSSITKEGFESFIEKLQEAKQEFMFSVYAVDSDDDVEYSNSRHILNPKGPSGGQMLIDLAGTSDNAKTDVLAHLDGVEQKPHEVNEENDDEKDALGKLKKLNVSGSTLKPRDQNKDQ